MLFQKCNEKKMKKRAYIEINNHQLLSTNPHITPKPPTLYYIYVFPSLLLLLARERETSVIWPPPLSSPLLVSSI